MIISIEEILDFVACPVLYKYRHVHKIEPPQPKVGRMTKNSVVELYDKALHKSVFYIFHRIQDGFYPSLANVSKTWGNVWIKPRAELESIRFQSTSWRDTHKIKETQGWNKLKAFHEFYKTAHGTPIMIDYKYSVPIGKHTLTGSIDLVETVRNEQNREIITMTEFVTDERNMPYLNIRRDWKVTASSYAFRKVMRLSEQKIVYHGIISGKRHDTVRDEKDFKQLEHLIDIIVETKEQGLYYPSFNERCETCPFQKLCEKGWFDVKD